MSTANRAALHSSLVRHIRHFIAGAILYNQKVADRVGLHLTDMQCLNILELLGPVTPGKLTECTGLTTGGVTVMLDRLEKAGYARREPNPNDRRSVLVRINTRKMRKIYTYYAEINEQMQVFLASTPLTELQTVADFFAGLNATRVKRLQRTGRGGM